MSLADTTRPEREVSAGTLAEARDLLEADFRAVYVPTTLDRITLASDGTADVDGVGMLMAPPFLDALAAAIGMPLGFAYGLSAELFRHNFEGLKHRHSRAVTVAHHRGVAVNLAAADYRPVRSADVVATLQHQDFWTLRAARIGDRGVDLDFVRPGREVTPLPGDVVETGVRVTNSETGFGPLKGSLFSLRLVCTNGAVMADALGTARWNHDPRVAYETSLNKFRSDLDRLSGRQAQQAGLYDHGLLQRPLTAREVVNLWRRLRGSPIEAPAVDRILGLEPGARAALQASVRERTAGLPALPTQLSLWNVHNRITASAQRLDFARRSRLERIGGGMLSEPSPN